MTNYDDPFKMIRNNFNFTFICEFLHNFSSAFFNGPDDVLPTSPYLEHLLLYQDDAKKINQFFIKLLKPLPGWRLVSQDNWFESLAKEYKKRDLEVDFPVPSTSSTILTIPLLQRLEILRNLCEFHLEQPEHFWELLRVKDGEAGWRIEPIAKDSQNRRFWLFSDARLYREIEGAKTLKKKSTAKSSSKADTSLPWDIEDENNWELVCLTRSDYDELLTSLEKEKSLLKFFRDEIIPKVEPILNFQLSQHKKYFRPVASERISLLPRKRSSRLLEKELEEEQRRLERAEIEKESERQRQALKREQADLFAMSVKSKEQVERDLSEERELRAEMRRLKKEKEMQIKEIEEAFYSNLEKNEKGTPDTIIDENVDIGDELDAEESDHDLQIPITPQAPAQAQIQAKSPIKLVFKISKPEEKTVVTNEVKEEIIDIVQEPIIGVINTETQEIKEDESKCIIEQSEEQSSVTKDIITITNEMIDIVEDDARVHDKMVIEYINKDFIAGSKPTKEDIPITVTEDDTNDIPITDAIAANIPVDTIVEDIHEQKIEEQVSKEIIYVTHEDADLLKSLSDNNNN